MTHKETDTVTVYDLAKSAAQLVGREPVQAALQQEPGPVLFLRRMGDDPVAPCITNGTDPVGPVPSASITIYSEPAAKHMVTGEAPTLNQQGEADSLQSGLCLGCKIAKLLL